MAVTYTWEGSGDTYNLIKNNPEAVSPEEQTKTVATIEGLKAQPTSTPNGDSGEIELAASMLNDEHNSITLINSNGGSYTLKLADGVTKYGASVKSDTATPTVTNGTATIKGTLAAGWKETSRTEITYQGDTANQTIAEIKGLKSDATAGDLTISQSESKITLADKVLGTDKIILSNTAPGKFELKLSEDSGTVGGGLSDESGWAAEGTTAYFRDVTKPSWTLNGNEVTYTAPISTDLVKITGLSEGLDVDTGTGYDRKIGTKDASGAFVEGITFGDAAQSKDKEITLKASVLGATNVELGGDGTDYTLALDASDPATAVPTKVKLADPTINLSGTTATVTGTLKAYYTLDTSTNTIAYTAPQNPTFATITGLSSTASTDATTGNISVALSDNSGTPKFTVTLKGGENGALGTSKIELTPATNVEDKGNTFTFNAELALTGSDPTTGKLGYDESDKYWSVSGRTAIYQYDTDAGYTFDTTDKKTITYTAAEKTTLASITNLATNLSVSTTKEQEKQGGGTETVTVPAYIAGITVTEGTPADNSDPLNPVAAVPGTIQLDKNVLGNDETSQDDMELTGTGNYILALNSTTSDAGYVPTSKEAGKVVLTLGANGAALTSSDTAFWTLKDTKTIGYTAETDKRELATITGLKDKIDTNTTIIDVANNANIVVPDLTADSSTKSSGVIQLGLGLLNGKNVAITNGANGNFTLGVITGTNDANVDVSAPTPSNAAWTISSTTATYKANLTAGYEVKSDGTGITYTTDYTGTNKATLATVKGLKSGLTSANISAQFTFGNVDSSTGDFTEATNGKVIQISADALGTSNVTVTGTNYTLALPDSGIVKSDDDEVTDGIDVWRVSGTTATYKKVTPAHYTLETGATSITYTAEADIPIKETDTDNPSEQIEKDPTTTYATITGLLKSGLKVKADNTIDGIALGSVDGSGTFEAAADGTVIQLSKGVLTTNTATPVIVTDGYAATKASKTYGLALNSDEADAGYVTPPTENTDKTWSVANVAASGSNPASVTATYKGSINAGWELGKQNDDDDVDNQITYKAREASHTFATVKGLKSGVTAQQLNKTSENEHIAIDGTVITLKKAALGTSPTITVEGDDGYTIALDDSGFRKALEEGYIWEADGTTYTYKNVYLDYYEQGTKKDDQDKDVADNTKIVYNAQSDNIGTIAKFAGLKSGLLNANGDMPTAAIEVDNDSAKTFTVTEDALNKAEVTISNLATGWSIEKGFASTNLQEGTPYWKIDGTNATYQHEVKAGYEIQKDADDNPTKITYTADTIVKDAELAGLKSGLRVVSRTIDGIDVDGTEITLDSTKVLTDSNVLLTTVEGGTAYTLSLEDDYEAPTDHNTAWVINGTTAKLVNYTQAFYAVNNGNNQIIYTKAKFGNNPATATDYSPTATEIPSDEILATLTNLKSGLTPVDGQIDGLEVSGSDIEVSANVLDKKNVANTLEDSTYNLTLKTTGDYKVDAPDESGKWSVDSKGVPTYTSTTTAGYKVDGEAESNTHGQILYSPQKVIKATINGLKSVKVKSDGSEVGLEGGTSIARTYRGINATFTPTVNKSSGATEKLIATIDLTGEVLNKKAVTLSVSGGTVDHTFALDSGVEVEAEDPVWNKAKGTNYATYTQTTPAGYSISSDDKKINYASSPSIKTIVKVVGLSKDIASSENGELVGVDYTSDPVPDNSATEADEHESGVITLSKEVLTNTNVTIGNEYDYKLALAQSYAVEDAAPSWTYDKNKGTATIKIGTTEGWAHKVTKKTVSGVETTTIDEKTIQYTPANLTSIATVSGLKKTLTVNADGEIEGLTIGAITPGATANDPATGKIGITSAVLNNANVKIDIPSAQKNKYKFTFDYDENDIKTPETGTAYWLTDQKKGNTSYQSDVTAGYDINTTSDAFTYSAATKSVYFTLSGLKKDSTGDAAYQSSEFAGIEVSTGTPKSKTVGNEYEVKLTDATILDGKKVTITNKTKNDDYNLNVDDIAVVEGGNKWTFSGNGTTATLKDYYAAGYTIASNAKSATYTDETAKATLLTIKGLKSGTKEADISIDDENKVTLSANALGTSTISITQGKTREKETTSYSFDPDMNSLADVTRSAEDPTWTVSNGTAVLKQVTGDGFVAPEAENPTSLVYKKKSTETLATVKGLSADLGVYSAAQLAENTSRKNTQIFTTTTTKNAQGKKVTTLNTDDDDIAITYDAELKTITLNKAAFNKKKVTVSGNGGYTLALASDVPTYAQTATEWTVSGTTANYRTYKQLYYEAAEDGKSVNYTKEEKGITYATVSGLKKGVTDAMLNEAGVWAPVTPGDGASGGVLTLDARFLGTSNVKIATKLDKTDKVDNFVLALSSSEDADKKVTTSGVTSLQAWSKASGGKSVLKGTLTAGYTLEFGGKTISYTNEKKNQVIATVSGLKNGAQISDSSGNITLDASQLNGKNVAVTTSKGTTDYKITYIGAAPVRLDDDTDDKLPTGTEALTSANPKGTFTLKGYVTTAGYTEAASGKAITYTKANADTKKVDKRDVDGKVVKEDGKTVKIDVYKATATLATITNIDKGELPTVSGNTITVEGNQVTNAKKPVTVNAGLFTVEFDAKYNNKAVTGSGNVDKIKILGTGVSVTGGKGDDEIDLGSAGANTLIYSNGDGNDVIANFTPGTDTLQIKSGTPLVEKSGNDFIVKVGTGSITLTGAADGHDELTIYNNKGVDTTYTTSAMVGSSPLLADDNYSMDAAQLSSIVEPTQTALTPYDYNTNFDFTKDNKMISAVTYAKSK